MLSETSRLARLVIMKHTNRTGHIVTIADKDKAAQKTKLLANCEKALAESERHGVDHNCFCGKHRKAAW